MTRRPDWIPTRKAWPAEVKRHVLERSNGICEWGFGACDVPGVELDHIVPVGAGGESTASNCVLLCMAHHREKTAQDVRRMAKADRCGGRSGQAARRKRAKEVGRHKAIPGRKLASRGFSKTYRKRMSGRVERREGHQ